MAVSSVQSATGTTAAGFSVTNTALGASPTVGNILTACIGGGTDGFFPAATSPGWNLANRGFIGQSVAIFYKIVQPGDPTTYTFTCTISTVICLRVQEWTGWAESVRSGGLGVGIGAPIDNNTTNQLPHNSSNYNRQAAGAVQTNTLSPGFTNFGDELALCVIATSAAAHATGITYNQGFTADDNVLAGNVNFCIGDGHLILNPTAAPTNLTTLIATLSGGTALPGSDFCVATLGPGHDIPPTVRSPNPLDPSNLSESTFRNDAFVPTISTPFLQASSPAPAPTGQQLTPAPSSTAGTLRGVPILTASILPQTPTSVTITPSPSGSIPVIAIYRNQTFTAQALTFQGKIFAVILPPSAGSKTIPITPIPYYGKASGPGDEYPSVILRLLGD